MDDLRKAYRAAVIIGLAMMAGLLVYTVIVGLFEGVAVRPAAGDASAGNRRDIVKFVLLGASIFIFFLIRIVNARMLVPGEGQRARSQAVPPPTDGRRASIQRLTVAAIVTFTLCEAPAVFGLVLFFLGGDSSDFYLFLIISLFCFASSFPRYSQWEEWYRQQGGSGRTAG